MKERRTRRQFSLLNIRGLIFIYLMLCLLTILFTQSFFSEIFYKDEGKGSIPSGINLVIFLTIPAVLLILLGIAVASLIGDIITRRPGVKFKARLLGYFIIIVLFTAVPFTIITSISINELILFWQSIDTEKAKEAAESFAIDSFPLHTENFNKILESADWENLPSELPEGINSIQDFRLDDDKWTEYAFYGNENGRLAIPPAVMEGHVTWDLQRDKDLFRYVKHLSDDKILLVNYSLGEEFDSRLTALKNQNERFEVIDVLGKNRQILLVFYYGVFLLPILMMTIIIAISFTRRITNPIVELTEATRHVAEGDFSIQILARRSDELGLLIRSFNAMVQDLEKSRAALIKAEKISIWQNMAEQLAHEIKNPLTPIKLSAERVLRRWRKNPEQIGEIIEDSMLAIIQETEGLSTLLNEFRTLSKPMEPSKSWTDLDKTLGEIVNLYSASYPEIGFNTEFVSKDITVKIDKHRFSQAMANLLINAIDSMAGKGSIDIRSDLVKKREIWYCRLSIKDSGKGISKNDSLSIFTPYFTTKNSGTGLGLPIVERIINDHNGAIWFNSGEGIGSTFFIDLPVSEEK